MLLNEKYILNNINNYIINNNYIIKKKYKSYNNKKFYFINKIDNSSVIKIIIEKNNIYITIPIQNSNFEYNTIFNDINTAYNFIKLHIN